MLPPNYDDLDNREKETVLRNIFSTIAITKGLIPCIPLYDKDGIDIVLVDTSKEPHKVYSVQLKSRFTLNDKYYKKGLHMGFYNRATERWYFLEYDKLQDIMLENTKIKDTESWREYQSYSSKSLSNDRAKAISSDAYNFVVEPKRE